MSDRGHRWGESDTVPEEWITAVYQKRAALGLPRINVRIEAEKFVNYWLAATGKGATKRDWPRTFINWCLTPYNAVPEAEPTGKPKIDAEAQGSIERVKLALRGMRTGRYNPRIDVPVALSAGAITKEQAKSLGV